MIECGPHDLVDKEIGASASKCVAARKLRDWALLVAFAVKRRIESPFPNPLKVSDASAYSQPTKSIPSSACFPELQVIPRTQ